MINSRSLDLPSADAEETADDGDEEEGVEELGCVANRGGYGGGGGFEVRYDAIRGIRATDPRDCLDDVVKLAGIDARAHHVVIFCNADAAEYVWSVGAGALGIGFTRGLVLARF